MLRSLPEYKRATKIACYLHMDGGEIETDEIIGNAFDDGEFVLIVC